MGQLPHHPTVHHLWLTYHRHGCLHNTDAGATQASRRPRNPSVLVSNSVLFSHGMLPFSRIEVVLQQALVVGAAIDLVPGDQSPMGSNSMNRSGATWALSGHPTCRRHWPLCAFSSAIRVIRRHVRSCQLAPVRRCVQGIVSSPCQARSTELTRHRKNWKSFSNKSEFPPRALLSRTLLMYADSPRRSSKQQSMS